MREPIAPLWKGNGPLHFHPHIQVSLSSRSGEFWACLSCTLSFVKCSFAAFQFPRTMYSCPQVSASLQPGTLTLSRVSCLWSLKLKYFLLLSSPEINEWLSLILRILQGWNDSSLLYLVDLFHAVCSCGSLSFVFTWAVSCWYNCSKSDENRNL